MSDYYWQCFIGLMVWFFRDRVVESVIYSFHYHAEQVWFCPKKRVSFSNTVVNQKPHFEVHCMRPREDLCPNVDFNVQTTLIPLPLLLCWIKYGTRANTETGRKVKGGMQEKKEKLIQDSEVERIECERKRKKMSSESIKA